MSIKRGFFETCQKIHTFLFDGDVGTKAQDWQEHEEAVRSGSTRRRKAWTGAEAGPSQVDLVVFQPGLSRELPNGPATKHSLCEFSPVSSREVRQLLKDLDPSKAAGPDEIPPAALKMVADEIAFPLSILFNESLATGVLPDEFKIGHLHPLLKPGKSNSKEASNYRGITLTCILSKVLEKVVHRQIYHHLESSGALSTSQFGFRRGHSCSDLLLSVVDDWLSARDSKLCTAVVFLDLTKAFDNVDHQSLLLLLQKCGIGGTVLSWIKNFLEDRRQRIVLPGAGVKSNWFMCNKGVPQGSVLGPLLFNVYVSDLEKLAKSGGASMPSFADDFTLYCAKKSPHEAGRAVSDALGNVADALEMKGLSLSPEKTVAMFITHRSTTDIPAVTCNGTPIKTVTQARLLGVIVDDQLSWREHVNHLYRKIARKIGALRRSSRQLTPTARRQFFVSVIQPDFEYAASTFVPTMSTAQKNRLLGLWRKAIRCTAGATWQCAVGPLLVELRLSNIEHLWALQLALMVQKCHLGTAPQDICKKLKRTKHSHETRGNQSCFTPFRPLTTSGSVCFSNRAPLIWNSLPQPIRTCTSYTSF